ncbi:hypothetical protein HII31_06811 [Pseudocercospora fuligena]|uniref:Glycine zipper 2TM domain-containing protein n=1 Tax=Pseudocercospora fuligena TaxID=685502 RepID=A0A8H6RKL1_9PEZI|nr:hypothetical protein HII31_06811 [Pseudocercospora fuligena]
MSYYPPQQYPPQGYGYQQYQSPPIPDHFPGEACPPRQTYSAPPQQQYCSYPPPMPQQQEPAWDPKRIYAEYGAGPQQQQQPMQQSENKGLGDFFSNQQHQGGMQQEGERGIGATVLGGAGGAFLGHEMGHGKLATLGGLAIGAIAANAFEHHHEKKKHEREEMRAYDSGYVNGEERRSRSRGIDDEYEENDRYSDCREDERYYDDEEERPRHHHHHHHERDYDDSYVDDREYQVEDYYRRDY